LALTVHVPHNLSLTSEITRADHRPRIVASEDLLQLVDRLTLLEGRVGMFAEGDIAGRIGDECRPLGLGHCCNQVARGRPRVI